MCNLFYWKRRSKEKRNSSHKIRFYLVKYIKFWIQTCRLQHLLPKGSFCAWGAQWHYLSNRIYKYKVFVYFPNIHFKTLLSSIAVNRNSPKTKNEYIHAKLILEPQSAPRGNNHNGTADAQWSDWPQQGKIASSIPGQWHIYMKENIIVIG